MGRLNIATAASVIDDGIIWFSALDFNGFFKYDIKNEKMKWISKFEGELESSRGLHSSVHICKDEVIFTPIYDRKLRIYNKTSEKLLALDIPANEYVEFFYDGILIDNEIYFMSNDLKMWVFDVKKRTIVEDIQISNLIKNGIKESEKKLAYVRSSEERMFLIELDKKVWHELNLVERKLYTNRLEINENIFSISFINKRYWIFFEDTMDIVIWEKCGTSRVHKAEDNEWLNERKWVPYVGAYQIRDKIFALNYYSKYIMTPDSESEMIKKAFLYPDGYEIVYHGGVGPCYINAFAYNNEVLFIPVRGNMLLSYDADKGDVRGLNFTIDEEEIPYWSKVKSQWFAESDVIEERTGKLRFSEWIDEIKKNQKKDEAKNIGWMIYELTATEENRFVGEDRR